MTLADLLDDEPGFESMANTRRSTILAFLRSLNEKYGDVGEGIGQGSKLYTGAKGYLIQELGFSIENLIKIKRRLAIYK